MDKQRTINTKVSLEGIGLHTGEKSKVELLPAPPNTGIIFTTKSMPSAPLIKADIYSVLDPEVAPRRTSVGEGNIYIHTIEHLMAALHLLRIDNLQINIWGEEVPGLDGSAKDFAEEMVCSGFCEQEAPRNYLTVKEPLWVEEGSSSVVILPYPCLRISYTLKYDHPLISSGYLDLVLNGAFQNLHEARTFCLEEEVESLLNMGLGKGSNYENTLVVSKKGVVENKLRFPDEFLKHKVLDLIGDLYLVGPLQGHVIAIKSGHSLNIKLLQKLRRYRNKVVSGGVSSQTSYVPQGGELNTEEIMKILPHRYPFLLVDRITYLEKGKRAVGVKNVSINEYFFQGHFPARPVMPGVLIIEAMAQVGGVLMLACEENKGKLAYFMSADNIKFRRTVEPGDQLVIEVVSGKIKKKIGVVHTKAFVDKNKVAEGELLFALVES